jgi:hypothetical protein
MSARTALIVLAILSVVPLGAIAKNKKKQILPDYVLKAETVLVVINPEAGEPVTNLTANRTAQENVEKALTQWGRFRLVMDARSADLIIAVRKGHTNGLTVRNSPTDSRPVTVQQSDGNVRIGGQAGRPPDLSDPGLGRPTDQAPRIDNEIGSGDDTFELYPGRDEYPLDSAPTWRYMAKNALDAPKVPAVEEFRKVLTESEKQHHKP